MQLSSSTRSAVAVSITACMELRSRLTLRGIASCLMNRCLHWRVPAVLIVGVPGAFTPPCSSHVPGYVEHADKFAEKGVKVSCNCLYLRSRSRAWLLTPPASSYHNTIKGIYVVAVNDAFATQAWKEKLGASSSQVHFLADDSGAVSCFASSSLCGNSP